MLEQAFNSVYSKFKLHFYQEIFRRFQDREASLTTVETFCMESIQALGRPTVNEFAGFMRISPPNAAYKVNSLVKKGYVRKVQSASDRREYHLEVTQKYLEDSNVSMAEEMTRMMSGQRVLQSSAQLLKMYDQLMSKMVILGSAT